MLTLVLALRGAAAVAVLALLVRGMPRLVAGGLAAAFGAWTAVIVQATDGATFANAVGVAWPLVAARELAIGATLGLIAAIPLVAAATAGRLVDVANGSSGPYRALFGVLAAAVFVGIDGHVAVVTAVLDSYRNAPALGALQPSVLDAIGSLVGSAVRLAVPWLVTAAIVEIAVGVGTRLAARSATFVPAGTAVPAALVMMTATLLATFGVAVAALVRGTLT